MRIGKLNGFKNSAYFDPHQIFRHCCSHRYETQRPGLRAVPPASGMSYCCQLTIQEIGCVTASSAVEDEQQCGPRFPKFSDCIFRLR